MFAKYSADIQIHTTQSPYSIIEISDVRLTNYSNLVASSSGKSLQQCAINCTLTATCNLFCWNASLSCDLYRIYATKKFIETINGTKSKCYTALNDLITGKTIEASALPAWFSEEKKFNNRKENLVNGIHDYSYCYISKRAYKPYFLIDLEAIYSFNMMTFKCPTGNSADEYCRGLYLKISNTSVQIQGNFSSFEDYGYFAGPGTPDQTVTFWKKASARYISMQMDLGFKESLKICFLRVI